MNIHYGRIFIYFPVTNNTYLLSKIIWKNKNKKIQENGQKEKPKYLQNTSF